METKPSKHKVSDNELLDDLKRVAKEFGKDKISFNMYEKFGVYYGRKISKRFGSWNNAKEKAGFQLNPYATLTKEELLEDLKRYRDFIDDISVFLRLRCPRTAA